MASYGEDSLVERAFSWAFCSCCDAVLGVCDPFLFDVWGKMWVIDFS